MAQECYYVILNVELGDRKFSSRKERQQVTIEKVAACRRELHEWIRERDHQAIFSNAGTDDVSRIVSVISTPSVLSELQNSATKPACVYAVGFATLAAQVGLP